jgi:hypothetical protein
MVSPQRVHERVYIVAVTMPHRAIKTPPLRWLAAVLLSCAFAHYLSRLVFCQLKSLTGLQNTL